MALAAYGLRSGTGAPFATLGNSWANESAACNEIEEEPNYGKATEAERRSWFLAEITKEV